MAPDGTVSASSRSRGSGWRLVFLPLALAILGAVVWWSRGVGAVAESESSPPVDAAPFAQDEHPSPGAPTRGGPPSSKGPVASVAAMSPEEQEREERRALWETRLERAQRTLESYVVATRYPPDSRPSREHPDQMELPEPERTRRLVSRTGSGDSASDVQMRLKQDKVFVVGEESVLFSVACEDERHTPRPCEVVSAVAHEAEHVPGAGGVKGVPLAFADDGAEGDARAGDGIITGRFQPSRQGFPLYSGTLRVDVHVRSGQVEDSSFFDILYTPAAPATFTRKVREVVENGSLQLYLGIQVRKAGRYVVSGRLDDESGVAFAYVSFNEELPEGAHEVKLTVFGKLIIDEAPTFPLLLRDVDGFLLKESGDPDRELMATLRGPVHTTREYAPTAFSPAEWQSEERTRYINRLTQDVDEAKQQRDSTGTPSPAPKKEAPAQKDLPARQDSDTKREPSPRKEAPARGDTSEPQGADTPRKP
ncbi:choice-of-anchor X domain-containing protein [Citreicoccus inhibens]|uniref:choice-of-anchor X domain-containing protein n=1 Tax=Citreicoccus inhibens TaxID=2849499 RepID=UPI001F2A273E|nr:choice-of-anchor X domain-containing protein [Citreicoccus inhibens]